ncbi:MAG: hypothetical protein ACI9J3_003313 [Parvicellaceae bacterium]|jgi:hypothetical protein
MESTLRFIFDSDRCLEILKSHASETDASNFKSLIKGKSFFGTFQDDNSFEIHLTAADNGSSSSKIIGESMNRVIPNDSICLFKTYTGGGRSGKIVLVENIDIQDQDFNSAFTIKTYSSEKIISDEGWKHTSIILRPNSYNETYKNIIITEDNGAEMRVVGEFIKILD